ncbi:MAG: hypothetical protein J6V01_07055, partial [Clostridia bacterium]|nr:hypothetical protein [Clostridia bacterium]
MYYSGDNLEFKITSEIKPTLEEELRGTMGEPVTFPKPIQKPGQSLPKPRHSFLRGRLKKLFLLQAVAATVGVSALLTGYGIDFLGDLFPPVVPGQTEETTAEETTGDETPGGVTDEETTSPETEGTSSSEETTDPDETTAPEDTAPDHVHVFGQQNTTVEPTCTEAGEAERVCSECGFVEKVPL